MYAVLKFIHISAVVLSGTGFALRYVLAAINKLPGRPWVRMAPHAVDTVLLVSALTLAWVGHFNPLAVPWLETKLVGLVVYILAGSIAMKRGRTPRMRAAAFAIAVLSYAYIVTVALTKNPLGPLAGGTT